MRVLRHEHEESMLKSLFYQIFVPCANIQRVKLAQALAKLIGPAHNLVIAIQTRCQASDRSLENLLDELALSMIKFRGSLNAAITRL